MDENINYGARRPSPQAKWCAAAVIAAAGPPSTRDVYGRRSTPRTRSSWSAGQIVAAFAACQITRDEAVHAGAESGAIDIKYTIAQ